MSNFLKLSTRAIFPIMANIPDNMPKKTVGALKTIGLPIVKVRINWETIQTIPPIRKNIPRDRFKSEERL